MKKFSEKFTLNELNMLKYDCSKYYEEMYKTKYYSKEKIREIQNEKFIKMLNYAYDNVPMYRTKYDEAGVSIKSIKTIDDITKLPILEKEEIIKNYPHNTISKKYDRSTLRELVTGGSTGKTVKLVQSDETLRMRVLTAFRIYDTILDRYLPNYIQTYVYTTNYPLDGLPDGTYKLCNVWSLDQIEVAKEKILDSKPHLLTLYPSILEQIRKNLNSKELKILKERLMAINVKSEMSTQKQRDEWEKFFGVGVYDEYGSEEMAGTVAAQCKHKGYHIWEDINIIEAVDESNNPVKEGILGEMIGTNLYSFAMPMIRYRQGDLISFAPENEKCPCGSNFRMLMDFEGRKNMSFTLKSGRFLSSGYLLDVGYTKLIDYRHALDSWALIQESKDKVVFECIPGESMTENIKNLIKKEIYEALFKEAEVEVRFVNELPKTPRGKRNQIISYVNNK